MKVKISNLTYEIVEETDGENVFCDAEIDGEQNQMRLGLTEFNTQKIYLYKNMSRERKKHVLKHELTHAFIDAFGLCFIDLTEDTVCEFVAVHSQEINNICNRYFEE